MCCEDNHFPKRKFKLFNSLFHSAYLLFSIRLFSIADLFALCYLCDVCNEDKCCIVTHRAADIRVAWLVCVQTYCVPIATLNQNKPSRLLYLGDAQTKRHRYNDPRYLSYGFLRYWGWFNLFTMCALPNAMV